MGFRKTVVRSFLRAASIAAITFAATTAHAQDSNTVEANAEGVQDIVVTAQFRSTNLQDTPLAITAISAEELASRSFSNIADVGKTAPSVTLRPASAGYGKSTQAYIRGIGQTDFNFALEPAVGFYVDDVYHASLFGTSFDLLDLERVEILRGPQGTLFGKNSIGGAVRLISKKPANSYEASIEGTYGSYERIDVRGMVNVPVVNELLALRLSFASKERTGYVDQVDFACAYPAESIGPAPHSKKLISTVSTHGNSCKVGTLGGERVRAGRAALRFTPSSDIEINLTGEIIRDSSEAAADSLVYINGSAPVLVNYNNNTLLPNFGVKYDDRFIKDPFVSFAVFENTTFNRKVPSLNTVNSESYSADLSWDITDNIQFKSITAYQRFNGRFVQNADNSPLPIALTDNIAGFKQFTQEFRFVGTAFDGKLDWATGVFAFDGESTLGGGGYLSIPNIGFDQNESTEASNRSAFAHGTFHLTDALSLTGGARYTEESKSYRFDRIKVLDGADFFPGGAFISPKSKFDRIDWKLGFDYKLANNAMFYGQFSTGFKGGGINPRPFSPAAAVPFGPETLNAYEAGIKTDLFSRKVRFNLAAYHSDYSNLQLSANGIDNNGAPSIIVANAGRAKVSGVEVEIQVRPAAGLQIDMSGSYMDFQIKDLGPAAGVVGGPTLDSKAPAAPEFKANAGIQYVAQLGNGSSITPRFDVYYQSLIYAEYTNNPLAVQNGYAVSNARLTYNAPGDEWYAAVSVTNVFDKFYYVNKFIQSGSYIFTGQPGRPREFAVTVGRRF